MSQPQETKRIPKIFVSYRRADSLAWVELLRRELEAQFGADNLFVDIEDIDLGDDFARIIEQRVGSCDVLLAVIGPHWLNAMDENGRRRIEQLNDYVRREIASAFSREIRVIPVFVAGARPPDRDDLPEDIADLAGCNGYGVRSDQHFRQDIDRLIAVLAGFGRFRNAVTRLRNAIRLRRVADLVVAASVLVVFFALWVRLFDILTLDERIETYTIWLGDWFKGEESGDKVVVVAITPDTEARLGKPFDRSWRLQHAQLIRELSDSGAQAVLFDLVLREPAPPFDEKLIQAIEYAKNKGTAFFFATDGEPSPISGLEAVTSLGHACIGRRLGYARVLPLVVAKDEGQALLPSLALLGVYPQGPAKLVDNPANRLKGTCPAPPGIPVRTARGIRLIDYYRYGEVQSVQHACPAIQKGDCTAEVIINFRSLTVLRDPARYYRYEDILELKFRTSILARANTRIY